MTLMNRASPLLAMILIWLPAAHTGATTFKIATVSPDGLPWMARFRDGVAEIEKRTDGRVTFKIYPGGVQGNDQTVLRKMRIGQLHGAVVATGSLTRFYPDLQVYNLPLLFRSFQEVDYVRSRMDPVIAKGLERNGMVTFPFIETGFAYMLSKNPVSSVHDLDDIKAWVPNNDPVVMKLIQSFGLTPVPLNISDVLAGLETGLIDSVTVPPFVAIVLQWHNHVQYITDLPVMYIYSTLAIDEGAYTRIEPTDRRVVEEVLGRVFRKIDDNNRNANKTAYQALLDQDITPVRPSPAELEGWRSLATQSIETLVRSGTISRQSVDRVNSHLEQFRDQTLAGN